MIKLKKPCLIFNIINIWLKTQRTYIISYIYVLWKTSLVKINTFDMATLRTLSLNVNPSAKENEKLIAVKKTKFVKLTFAMAQYI